MPPAQMRTGEENRRGGVLDERRPKLVDLFCGAGGASMGYWEAGFDVTGVDHRPQPNYPFPFIRGDALEFIADHYGDYAAVAASPPCQAHTSMRHFGKGAGEGAPELIPAVRELLQATGLPYVIENVVGSPLINPVRLCGSSFGLNVWRHRLFESNVPIMALPCAHHLSREPIAVYGDHPQTSKERGTYRVRRARTLAEGQVALGIDWMPWRELTQAIPPAMTRHVGSYLLSHLQTQPQGATA